VHHLITSQVQHLTTSSHRNCLTLRRLKYQRRRVPCTGQERAKTIIRQFHAQVFSYRDPGARDPEGRTGGHIAKKIDQKQILPIQSRLDKIMRPVAQQVITDINDGTFIKEMGLRCLVERRVATAGVLMHKNSDGRDNRARERGPHKSQEQVNLEILKEFATLIAARTTKGMPGPASVAFQQCMAQFGLYDSSSK